MAEEIRQRLLSGESPAELVREGFPKSSVYREARRLTKGKERLKLLDQVRKMAFLAHIRATVSLIVLAQHMEDVEPGELLAEVNRIVADFYMEEFGEEPPV